MRENDTFQNRPITMNHHNNLLEIEEHMYILDDVKKPNVFRNMFPYSEIPKIPFNDRIVPHKINRIGSISWPLTSQSVNRITGSPACLRTLRAFLFSMGISFSLSAQPGPGHHFLRYMEIGLCKREGERAK